MSKKSLEKRADIPEIGEIDEKDFRFKYLINIDVFRQQFPQEYEKSKGKEVEIFFFPYEMNGFCGERIANYCISCRIFDVMLGMPGHYDMGEDATPEKVDKILREEVEILKKEGFTNINYIGSVEVKKSEIELEIEREMEKVKKRLKLS